MKRLLFGTLLAIFAVWGMVKPDAARADATPVFASESELLQSGALKTTRKIISYRTEQEPGTVVIDTEKRNLYLVLEDGKAYRYRIGVGRPGFEWAGTHRVTRKKEWPGWTPPPEMRRRQPYLPVHMPGGPDNPMGARALYLGSTLYRIHGTIEPYTIGSAVSSGCIRMLNDDVIDLYERVGVGAKVIVS
ncbi:MAG: L,D-transpeptidase [Fimbriimonadaceae bacterium]|nr:L,D-transpeptidase [Alphaproteobacteria bacterium]